MAQGESYLFYGPEIGEKQDAMAEIKQRFIFRIYGDEQAQPNIETTTFYPGETSSADIAAFLFTGSLFSDGRVVYVKNIDAFKESETKNIASYICAPVENTLLFMTSDETKPDKTLETACGKRNTRVFWELFDHQKPQWLRNYWQKQGFRLTDDAVDTLLEMIENNTDALRGECSRLMMFFRNEQKAAGVQGPLTVDAAAIEKHLSHTRNESAFTLFSAIAAGDLQKSLEILHALLAAQESPVSIFAGLGWNYHKFRDYCGLYEKGLAGNDFELKKIGITTPKAKKDYPLAFKNYGHAASRFISITSEFDMLLRAEGSALKETLMDVYLHRIMRERLPSLQNRFDK